MLPYCIDFDFSTVLAFMTGNNISLSTCFVCSWYRQRNAWRRPIHSSRNAVNSNMLDDWSWNWEVL